MANPGTAPYDVSSPGPNNALAGFKCTTNGAAVPDGIEDDDNIIGTPTYDGVGIMTFPLSRQWRKVRVVGAQILDSTATVFAKATAVVEGFSSTNSVTIQTESGGAAANTNNKDLHVTLKLIR
jgi:hypothetical protein